MSLSSRLRQHCFMFVRVVVGAALAVEMVFKLFAEFLDEGDGGHRRCVAERAEGAAQHVFGEVADVVDVLFDAAAGM